MSNMDEEVLIVDEDNNEVGKATRSAGVVIVNSLEDPHIIIHKRTHSKEVFPSFYDVCFGGVVACGEDYTSAARRELLEESGLDVPADKLIYLGEYKSHSETTRSFHRFYFQESEVEFVESLPLNQVEDKMKTLPFMRKCPVILDRVKEYIAKNSPKC